MDGLSFFRVWAPESSVWSRWVKPALFLQMESALTGYESDDEARPLTKPPDCPWLSHLDVPTAVVVDLPGPVSVDMGLRLAESGYRPIPLYNAWSNDNAVHSLSSLHASLAAATDKLARVRIPDDAPPVFLLDSDRLSGIPVPGNFDNRWIVFPQDFPSGRFLSSRGIRQVLLLRSSDGLKEDLMHVLRRYQEDGLPVLAARPEDRSPASLRIPRPTWFRSTLYRVITYRSFRRNNAGGFGGILPEPSSSGMG